MDPVVRIGTRESQLALWQANLVRDLLSNHGFRSELVLIKSGGDIDLKTPLYEMGVQGIFTKELDVALLNDRIDIAVHSLKDIPTQLASGLQIAAVLQRGPHEDLLVFKNEEVAQAYAADNFHSRTFNIATSSIRRKAQWLHKFPAHKIHNLRGNVNTRLRKLAEEDWDAAIFARAGLERINLRPPNSVVLDWMLPAPAQGAIAVACRQDDSFFTGACNHFNDADTLLCTRIERDFLRALLGGCSTPISAFATVRDDKIIFEGNILSVDGTQKRTIKEQINVAEAAQLGTNCAIKLLKQGGKEIADAIKHGE